MGILHDEFVSKWEEWGRKIASNETSNRLERRFPDLVIEIIPHIES